MQNKVIYKVSFQLFQHFYKNQSLKKIDMLLYPSDFPLYLPLFILDFNAVFVKIYFSYRGLWCEYAYEENAAKRTYEVHVHI
jgi:hypothetical protein